MLSLTAKRSVYRASSRAFYALRFNSTKSQDPFPLPLSRELGEQIAQDYDGPRPEPRQETVDTLRARLTYQSRKRGTLECDLLLSTFASENLSTMSEAELREYDQLLEEPEWQIYYWAIGKREPPPRWAESQTLQKLQVHARNEAKVVRRMPDLRHSGGQ